MKYLSFGEILIDEINGETHAGGAAFNFSAHLAKLGNQVTLISALGNDEKGKFLLKTCKKYGIDTSYLKKYKSRDTGLSIVKTDEDGVPEFTIKENVAWDNIILNNDKIEALKVAEFDCFYFGSLAIRSAVSRKTLVDLTEKIKIEKFCDLNLRKGNFDNEVINLSLDLADYLKVNNDELEIISSIYCPLVKDREKKCKEIMKRFDLELLIITLGADGCMAFYQDKKVRVPGIGIRVIDTVGAGDAFSASFLDSFLVYYNLEKACLVANEYASKIASQAGAI